MVPLGSCVLVDDSQGSFATPVWREPLRRCSMGSPTQQATQRQALRGGDPSGFDPGGYCPWRVHGSAGTATVAPSVIT
jgi:hypothetical protein